MTLSGAARQILLAFWERFIAHFLELAEHVFAFALRQIQIRLDLVDFIINVIVELFVEFKLDLLFDILLEVWLRGVGPIRRRRHRVVLLNLILHHQIWRQTEARLRLWHHVPAHIVTVLELELRITRQQTLPNLAKLRLTVQIYIVEGLLDGRQLLERLSGHLLRLLHSHRLVVVVCSLGVHAVLVRELADFILEALWLHVLGKIRQLRPIFVGDCLGLEPLNDWLFRFHFAALPFQTLLLLLLFSLFLGTVRRLLLVTRIEHTLPLIERIDDILTSLLKLDALPLLGAHLFLGIMSPLAALRLLHVSLLLLGTLCFAEPLGIARNRRSRIVVLPLVILVSLRTPIFLPLLLRLNLGLPLVSLAELLSDEGVHGLLSVWRSLLLLLAAALWLFASRLRLVALLGVLRLLRRCADEAAGFLTRRRAFR